MHIRRARLCRLIVGRRFFGIGELDGGLETFHEQSDEHLNLQGVLLGNVETSSAAAFGGKLYERRKHIVDDEPTVFAVLRENTSHQID